MQTELCARENADYGDSFNQSMNRGGIQVARIRIEDKLRRIGSLMKSGGEGKVKDEKLEDTFIDLANYAMMTILWIENHKNNNEEKK